MYSPEHQMVWDSNLKSSEFIPLQEGKKSFGFTYTANHKQFTIKSRDFYEKGFNFFHEGKFYRYSCSVRNSEEGREVPKETVRGETIYNMAIMYRDQEDDQKLKFSVVTQCDFKINVPAFMLTSFLPKATKGWMDNINKYYAKSHKKM